jgi:SgrR family transcriptional regulator
MKSNEHFMQMLLGLTNWERGHEQVVGIEELSRQLCCTPRNVKFILRKWESEGLLRWQAGVGRGNHSTLTLLCDTTDFLITHFRRLLNEGKVGEAVGLINHHQLPITAKRVLQNEWNNQFGLIASETEQMSADVLRIPRTRSFSTMDPIYVAVAAESHFVQQICHRLIEFDVEKQQFIPQLAHAWECNEEMNAWTFYLRKGVRFHHGRLFTGKDVAYTVERLQQSDSPYKWQMEDVVRLEHHHDRKITFHLSQPNGFFLHLVGSIALSILPYDVPFAERSLTGTGPFRIAEFTNERLVLEAFEDYYRERALLDRVEIWVVPESTYPYMRYLLPEELGSSNGSMGRREGAEYLEAGCYYLSFNFNRPGAQHDYAFRKAMRLVMDRHQFIEDNQENREKEYSPAGSFLPEKSKTMSFPSTSLDEAAASLKQSAYRGETLTLFVSEGYTQMLEAKWVQERCRKIGLQLQLESRRKDEYLSPANRMVNEADMAMMGEVLQRDIEMGLIEVYKNNCTLVHRFLDDEKRSFIEHRLSQVLRLPDREKRMQALALIEEQVNDELWLLFQYHIKRTDKFHPALQGVLVDSFGWGDFSKMWVK